jgi:tetratricopeptide (TPR) repeat protein
MSRTLMAAVLAMLGSRPAAGQVADIVERGRAQATRDPEAALSLFRQVLDGDSLHLEATWRAAIAAAEWGEQMPDSARGIRDSLYLAAARYARRAVAIDSADPNARFALAMALGRLALTKGRRARLRDGPEIHAAATRGLELAPDHDGLHHVLGLWHAEVMRLSGISRFLARNILGAKVLGQARWDTAIEHLERAVALDSTRIYHRLDLARVYADRKRWGDARAQLLRIPDLPDRVPLDPRYRSEAEALRARIAEK